MGITRVRAVKKYKKKELEKALRWVVAPPVVLGVLLFGTGKKKKRGKRK